MTRQRRVCGLIAILTISTVAKGQLLNGDAHFPIMNELRWELTMNEAQSLCEQHHLVASSTDSAIVITMPVLGFASRTELQFDSHSKTLKSVQARFDEPTKFMVDSITNHLTRIIGRRPVRTAKEKSLLIITIRMEMALWKSSTGLVNLVTATRGESLFDASLVFFPPVPEQKIEKPKQ